MFNGAITLSMALPALLLLLFSVSADQSGPLPPGVPRIDTANKSVSIVVGSKSDVNIVLEDNGVPIESFSLLSLLHRVVQLEAKLEQINTTAMANQQALGDIQANVTEEAAKLRSDLAAIELTPGPEGPPGEDGLQGRFLHPNRAQFLQLFLCVCI
eukprot:TRINITY_DN8436_c0_g1_i1.p1 TRINITY_DN8436_c0_g1~~TRINITY_DN8436_c0_g1_i1.p1  ORF type:complete len:156 (+),score=25.68 TRINITY_DN8436_c0_g1_i1:78-545(+)